MSFAGPIIMSRSFIAEKGCVVRAAIARSDVEGFQQPPKRWKRFRKDERLFQVEHMKVPGLDLSFPPTHPRERHA